MGETAVNKACALGLSASLWFGASCPIVLAGERPAHKVAVALTYFAPNAKSVGVAGSFDPWWQKLHPMKKDANGRWSVVVELPPGRYELHFLVDGQWRHDPGLPSVEDGLGGRNNVILVFP